MKPGQDVSNRKMCFLIACMFAGAALFAIAPEIQQRMEWDQNRREIESMPRINEPIRYDYALSKQRLQHISDALMAYRAEQKVIPEKQWTKAEDAGLPGDNLYKICLQEKGIKGLTIYDFYLNRPKKIEFAHTPTFTQLYFESDEDRKAAWKAHGKNMILLYDSGPFQVLGRAQKQNIHVLRASGQFDLIHMSQGDPKGALAAPPIP